MTTLNLWQINEVATHASVGQLEILSDQLITTWDVIVTTKIQLRMLSRKEPLRGSIIYPNVLIRPHHFP